MIVEVVDVRGWLLVVEDESGEEVEEEVTEAFALSARVAILVLGRGGVSELWE